MKITIGLVTFLLIGLMSCRAGRDISKWDIQLYFPFHSTVCNAVLVDEPRIFIADPNCIENATRTESNISYYSIQVDNHQGRYIYESVAKINKSNIFYNENLTPEFDKSKRNVAVLITDQPMVSDSNRSLLSYTAQYMSDRHWDYNENSQVMHLPDTQEIDYSNCELPTIDTYNYNHPIDSCIFSNNSFWCSYSSIASTDWDKKRINFVFCNTKIGRKRVVVGIVPKSEQRKRMTMPNSHEYVEIYYIGDLRDKISAMYQSWLAENPKQLTYESYRNSGNPILVSSSNFVS